VRPVSERILELPAPRADERIAYGDDPAQFGDLRLPATGTGWPVVLLLHGGYYRARYGLDYFGHAAAALTSEGIATWNVEYRRLGNPGGGWPATFTDVGAAVDFLRVLVPRYGLDLRRVVAVGHSAGGHLALWAAGRQRVPAESPLHAADPLALAGVVSLAGVCDLREGWRLRLSDGVIAQLMEGSPDEHRERYAAASPPELLPLRVSQVLIHGTADEHVPYVLSREYAAAASAAGDPVEMVTLDGVGHFELVNPTAPEWRVVRDATLRLL
jgi:acetyl esterase/lipase